MQSVSQDKLVRKERWDQSEKSVLKDLRDQEDPAVPTVKVDLPDHQDLVATLVFKDRLDNLEQEESQDTLVFAGNPVHGDHRDLKVKMETLELAEHEDHPVPQDLLDQSEE